MLRTKALLPTVAPTAANAATSATPDGSFYANGTDTRTFYHGVGFSGYGETTYNNIASSKWVVGGVC